MLKRILGIGFLILFISVQINASEISDKFDLYKLKVDQCAKYLETNGIEKTELACINKKGDFFFDNGAGYIFIIDSNGLTHAHGAKPTLKGKNLIKVKDVKGFPFFKGLINMAKDYGDGWVEYWWPKPKQVKASIKVSYVKLVKKNGIEFVVGSGFYDVGMEDIYKIYPAEKKKNISSI